MRYVTGIRRAFLDFLKQTNDLKNGQIAIAGDLRESTERILKVVHSAIKKAGLKTIFCGKIPTPAISLVRNYKRNSFNYGNRKSYTLRIETVLNLTNRKVKF